MIGIDNVDILDGEEGEGQHTVIQGFPRLLSGSAIFIRSMKPILRTGPLALACDRERFLSALVGACNPLADHVYEVDALSLMRQSDPGSKFEVIARQVLQGACSRA